MYCKMREGSARQSKIPPPVSAGSSGMAGRQHNMVLFSRLKAQVMQLSPSSSSRLTHPHPICSALLPPGSQSCLPAYFFSLSPLLHHSSYNLVNSLLCAWELTQTKHDWSLDRVMGAGIMLTPQHPTIIENASVSLNPFETATAEIPSDNAAPVLLVFAYLWSFWKAKALCWALCYYPVSQGVGEGKQEQCSAAQKQQAGLPLCEAAFQKLCKARKRKQLNPELPDNPWLSWASPGLAPNQAQSIFCLACFLVCLLLITINTGKERRGLR